MTNHRNRTTPRRSARHGAALAIPGLGVLALSSVSAPAAAAPPTEWDNTVNGTPLEAFLLLGVLPLAIIVGIALLTYLPSMMKRQRTDPAMALSQKPEWFGGSRKSAEDVRAAPVSGQESEGKGGASARW